MGARDEVDTDTADADADEDEDDGADDGIDEDEEEGDDEVLARLAAGEVTASAARLQAADACNAETPPSSDDN